MGLTIFLYYNRLSIEVRPSNLKGLVYNLEFGGRESTESTEKATKSWLKHFVGFLIDVHQNACS